MLSSACSLKCIVDYKDGKYIARNNVRRIEISRLSFYLTKLFNTIYVFRKIFHLKYFNSNFFLINIESLVANMVEDSSLHGNFYFIFSLLCMKLPEIRHQLKFFCPFWAQFSKQFRFSSSSLIEKNEPMPNAVQNSTFHGDFF